jgi:putative oxidoreductase
LDIGLLILRVVVGALFIGHGTQKLFGWFGGHGLSGTAGFLESLGMRPGRLWAVVNGLVEAGGGLLLALGLLTPLAAAALVGVMTMASLLVHVPRGLWNAAGGYELPLVFATAATALAFTGPGRWSIDRALGLDLAGIAYGVGAAAVGVAVAVALFGWRNAMVRRVVPATTGPAEEWRPAA